MISWEYKIERTWRNEQELLLKSLGGQGWELTAVIEIEGAVGLLYFKRPLGDPPVQD